MYIYQLKLHSGDEKFFSSMNKAIKYCKNEGFVYMTESFNHYVEMKSDTGKILTIIRIEVI